MIFEIIEYFLIILGVGFASNSIFRLKEENPFAYLALGIMCVCFVVLALGFTGLLGGYGLIGCIIVAFLGWASCLAKNITLKFDMEFFQSVVVFAVLLVIFVIGSSYSWLEDNDPVEHASGLVYIGQFHSFLQPVPTYVRYLAPYPPMYDAFMAWPYELTHDAPNTLKTMNAVLCALAAPFAFLWFKERYGRLAVYMMIILAVLPGFMSHFIWAQTLAILMMFPALYFYERYHREAGYGYVFILMSALVFITQPSVAFIFGCIMLLYAVTTNRLSDIKLLALAVALAAMIYWLPAVLLYGIDNTMSLIHVSIITGNDDSSGGVIYGLSDFMSAPTATKIDQPTGWGFVIFVLLVYGVVSVNLKEYLFELALLAFCLIGVEGNALPFKLFPHRFWVFLAIPVAIFSAVALSVILDFVARFKSTVYWLIVLGLAGMLYVTALEPKMTVQGSPWPPGMFVTQEQFAGYMHLKQLLPPNTLVYNFCSKETMMDGIGLRGLVWDDEVWDHKGVAHSNIEDRLFLETKGYEYAVVDDSCLNDTNLMQVQDKLLWLNKTYEMKEDLSSNRFFVFGVR